MHHQPIQLLRRCLLLVTSIWFLAWLPNTRAAHPYHVCIAQITWNAKEVVWEVSIRIHPQDLERSMAGTKEQSSLEDDDFPDKVTQFLNREFYMLACDASMTNADVNKIVDSFTSKRGAFDDKAASEWKDRRSHLEWVGMENERGWVWLHFTMQNPKEAEPGGAHWFVHRILIDEVERQENSLLVLPQPGIRYSLQFKKDEIAQRLK